MPLYKLEDIKYLVSQDAWELATPRCRDNRRSLGLTSSNVKAILLALRDADFRRIYGPADSDYGVIQADDYRIWIDEGSMERCAPDKGTYFYIKFGIHSDAEGDLCAVVSFHLEGRP